MARDNFVQIVGSMGGDVDLRFTPSGVAVASFSVAWTPRKRNSQTDEWEDGETSWFRCTAWRDMAENAAASLTKGSRVIVTGSVTARDWEDRDGNKRTSIEIDVEDVAPSLRWAQAQVDRTERQKGSSGGGGSSQGRPQPQYADEDEPFTRWATEGDL